MAELECGQCGIPLHTMIQQPHTAVASVVG